MKRIVFLDQSVGLVFQAVIVGSIYLLFVGHNQPGGGFVGGLVAGAAISLRYLAGGLDDVRNITRFPPWTLLGGGVAVSVVTALVPLLRGDPVLTSLGTDLDIPVLGEAYASTTLAFDVGVYFVVIGLVFMVFEAFGDDRDEASAGGKPDEQVEPGEHVEPGERVEPAIDPAGSAP